jgi:hypothetical protein
MAKVAANACNIALATVVLEDDIDNFSLAISQEAPVVTSFADAGPRRVVGNYDFTLDVSGSPDFTAAMSDATIYGFLGASAVKAMAVDPTGKVDPADANNPHYNATDIILTSYSISGAIGGRIDYSASFAGNSALTRAVS